jgi:hypothetical protein
VEEIPAAEGRAIAGVPAHAITGAVTEASGKST